MVIVKDQSSLLFEAFAVILVRKKVLDRNYQGFRKMAKLKW
jgi:hypothetical protein